MNTADARRAISAALAQVAPEVSLDEIAPDEPMRAALDLDSLDFLALVEHLHKLTGVNIAERDYGDVDSIDRLSAYLATHSDTNTTAGMS
ncbi:MAG TPA: phosphopantetheine-binding protein [Mycobacterium sp.]|nr:phosphopantetheine-binding protein [Mycobacterium sp.]